MSISGGRGAVPSPRHLLPQDQLHPRHPSPWPGCPPHHRRGHLHQHRPHHPHHPNNHDHHPSHFHFDTWYHLFLSSYPHHDLYLIVFIFQWQQASCPILYFVIEYKLANQLDWTIGDLSKQSLQLNHEQLIITTALCAVTNNLQVQDVYSIRGLQPATSYDLKVKNKTEK